MKLYELKIEDESVDEVFAISLVESPAIESDFVYFDKEEVMFASIDKDQQMLIGRASNQGMNEFPIARYL